MSHRSLNSIGGMEQIRTCGPHRCQSTASLRRCGEGFERTSGSSCNSCHGPLQTVKRYSCSWVVHRVVNQLLARSYLTLSILNCMPYLATDGITMLSTLLLKFHYRISYHISSREVHNVIRVYNSNLSIIILCPKKCYTNVCGRSF